MTAASMTAADSHLVFTIRSRAAVRLTRGDNDAATRRLLVRAVPAIGARGRAAQQVCMLATRVLPARAIDAIPLFAWVDDPFPLPADVITEVEEAVRARSPEPFDRLLWLLKPTSNAERAVAALLLAGERPVAHLRVLETDDRDDAPQPTVGGSDALRVRWPVVIDRWSTAGLGVELTTAFPLGEHRATDLSLSELNVLCDDISDALDPGSVVAPQPHWRPMHGDFTPWNLRTFPSGERVLFDWEHTGWGPPGADLVRYLSTSETGLDEFRSLPAAQRAECAEAVEHWHAVATERQARHLDVAWKQADSRREIETLDRFRAAAAGRPPAST